MNVYTKLKVLKRKPTNFAEEISRRHFAGWLGHPTAVARARPDGTKGVPTVSATARGCYLAEVVGETGV